MQELVEHYRVGDATLPGWPSSAKDVFLFRGEIHVSTVAVPPEALVRYADENKGSEVPALEFDGHQYISLRLCQLIHPNGAELLRQLEDKLRRAIAQDEPVTIKGWPLH